MLEKRVGSRFPAALLAASWMILVSHLAMADCGLQVNATTTVNGESLWSEVPELGRSDCVFDQFAWNNFLYFAKNVSSAGTSRFMTLIPWYEVLPASGEPDCNNPNSTKILPLSATQLHKLANQQQAGDTLLLKDVANRFVAYDIRVNWNYCHWTKTFKMYTKSGFDGAVLAYQTDPLAGGIWLPPRSIEIKTSWRDFGTAQGTCPSDLMICQKDDRGNWWGLLGVHLVQKTKQHGEFVWAAFEHVANSPDCRQGGSNPIAFGPGSPSVNVNKNIANLRDVTGWNLFNHATYKDAGGDGKTCAFPEIQDQRAGTCKSVANPLCLLDPNPTGNSWRFVNVCRTDQLPGSASNPCSNAADNGALIACLNTNVWNEFWQRNPKGYDPAWRYYQLIGVEWLFSGATGLGAPTSGCVTYPQGEGKYDAGYTCSAVHSAESPRSLTRAGSVHMASTSMETWMQKDICVKTHLSGTLTQQDCFSCHQPPTQTLTAPFQGGFSHLFGRIQQAGNTEDLLRSLNKAP